MVAEDNKFVLHGPPPSVPLKNVTLGVVTHESILNYSYDRKRIAMTDAFTHKQITYKQLLDQSCHLAECMRLSGYGKDIVVSISSENSLQFYVPLFASMYIGAIMAPINHHYTFTELRHHLNLCKPKLIFCSNMVAQKYVELKREFSFIQKIIIIDSGKDTDGAESLQNFVQRTLRGKSVVPEKFKPFSGDYNQPALLLCSSGTTGLPKGVLLSHKNLLVRILQTRDPNYTMLKDNEKVLGVLPFFHAYGLIGGIGAILNGHRIVVMKNFDEDVFLKSIEEYRISVLWLAPPLLVFLAKTPKIFRYDLSSLREVYSGAAPLSKLTQDTAKNRLNVQAIKQGYGLTEATLAVIINGMNEEVRAGSSGKVISFMSVKIRDTETGKSLGPHQIGEICVKGPLVMLGYYGNEEATKNSFTSDGWLRTGDLGYYDEDQYFFIVDRLKELIKYKGFQVAPAELEAILINHPGIRDAGVVGLPDEACGELPVAFVTTRVGVQLTEKEIQDYVAERVSSSKRLRGGVIFIPEIPKNPSGKILRRELRQMLMKHKSKL